MKKIISTILAMVMVLSITVLMSACGNDTGNGGESTKPQTSNTSQAGNTPSTNDSVFPAALKDVQAIEIPEVGQTGWTLSGGMIDGVEMEEADVQGVLSACGGKMQFIFISNKDVQMINGEKTFEGTYEITDDNFAFHATFTGYEYYGVFSMVDDTAVLIIANPKVPETALYLTQIDEH